MQELGQTLRAAREAKGLTLADAEEATRIRLRFLEALESGRQDDLPARVYAEGFLRNYAIFLGLSPQELLEQFRRAQEGDEAAVSDVRAAVHPLNLPPGRRSRLVVGLVLVLAGILLAAGWYLLPALGLALPFPQGEAMTATPTVAPEAAQSPAATPPATAPTPTSIPVANATATPTTAPTAVVRVVVQARFTALSWIRVTVDGQLDFEGFMEAGATRQWSGVREVAMVCGNAGGTEVTVNGVNRGPLGAPSQVVEIAWTRP
jgi:cytoskeletal protein RodZ